MTDGAPSGDEHEHPHLDAIAAESLNELPELPPETPKRPSTRDLAFREERPSMIAAMGGPLGMVESGVPSAAFVVAITAGAHTKTAAIISVAIALLFAAVRLARRETVQFAITGVFGVGISALIAGATGKAKSFFLPSFLINLGYGVIALVSIVIRRPFVGYIAEGISMLEEREEGEEAPPSWREDTVKMRVYSRASWIWVAIFFGRLAIEVPFYIGNHLVALGTAKIILAYPLYGVGVWLTWVMVRSLSLPPKGGEPIASTTSPGGTIQEYPVGGPVGPLSPDDPE